MLGGGLHITNKTPGCEEILYIIRRKLVGNEVNIHKGSDHNIRNNVFIYLSMYLSMFLFICLQWLNQSHNACINYCNRNATKVSLMMLL